jgi:hypothetical protein
MIDRDKIMADARIKRLTTSLSRDEIRELNRVKSERTVKRKGASAVRCFCYKCNCFSMESILVKVIGIMLLRDHL